MLGGRSFRSSESSNEEISVAIKSIDFDQFLVIIAKVV